MRKKERREEEGRAGLKIIGSKVFPVYGGLGKVSASPDGVSQASLVHHIHVKNGFAMGGHETGGGRPTVARAGRARAVVGHGRILPDSEVHHLSLGLGKLALEQVDLLLERRYGPDTAIDRVPYSGVGFVDHATHGISSLVHR